MKKKGKREPDLTRVMFGILAGVILIGIILYVLLAVNAKKIRVKDTGETKVQKEALTESGGESEVTESEQDTVSQDTQESGTPVLQEVEEAEEPVREIRTLTDEELASISGSVGDQVSCFILTPGQTAKDENGRPITVNELIRANDSVGNTISVYCGEPTEKKVSLMFATGTETGYASEVLDVLRRYNVHGTFFISHSFGAKGTQIVQRMIDDGHEVGNLSYLCPEDGTANESLADQMTDAINMQRYVEKTFSYTMQKYMLNGGYWSLSSVKLMNDMGYRVCFGSAGYPTASEAETSAILEGLKSDLHPGCTYILDTTDARTPEILAGLLDHITAEGYSIVK